MCSNYYFERYLSIACAAVLPAPIADITVAGMEFAEGKDADIIITDGDFNVLKTIIGGEVKYEI